MRFTADIEWNGKEVARRYLQNQNISHIFQEIKDEKALENFLLNYGEAIVEQIGTFFSSVSFCISFRLFFSYFSLSLFLFLSDDDNCTGDEVDRLEKKIQESIPEARYVDLETS